MNIIIEVYGEKQKDEQKGGIITAFYSAYFARLKTLSSDDLNKILDRIDKGDKGMTDAEMMAAMKQFCKGNK